MLEPILPAQMSAVIYRPDLPDDGDAHHGGSQASAPNSTSVGCDCKVSTMPMMKVVSPTSERAEADLVRLSDHFAEFMGGTQISSEKRRAKRVISPASRKNPECRGDRGGDRYRLPLIAVRLKPLRLKIERNADKGSAHCRVSAGLLTNVRVLLKPVRISTF